MFFIKVSSKFFLFKKKNSSTKGAFYTCLYLSKLATNLVRVIKVPKVKKQTPPKVGILILDPISKFSKIKNETQKDPLKFQKI